MSNPYLPKWEYIPDGEPRVFGDRVYVYGSHDCPGSTEFCDFRLRVWSAPIDDLEHWVCHGDVFQTIDDDEHKSNVDYSNHPLYAPDVVEKDGKYYLYAYVVNAKGCVAVSDKPEGPFKFLSTYEYNIENHYDNGTFIDPGVLVDDDGRVYVYCGYLGSYMAEIDSSNMYKVIDGTYQLDIIPTDAPYNFFEACSMRKVGDTYYMIYSPKIGSRLDYATSDSPRGPFTYRGTIVDNGVDYPGGNDHGSICKINNQWYIFYHRMTNNTCQSRRACVERIEILPDGSIPQVEMTSLGFSKALSPYDKNAAELACVIKGGCYITEEAPWSRPVIKISDGCVVGYKYYEFGSDTTTKFYTLCTKFRSNSSGKVTVKIDNPTDGEVLGSFELTETNGEFKWYTSKVSAPTGRHSLYFVFEDTSGTLEAAFEEFVFTIDNTRGSGPDSEHIWGQSL